MLELQRENPKDQVVRLSPVIKCFPLISSQFIEHVVCEPEQERLPLPDDIANLEELIELDLSKNNSLRRK